MKLRTLEITRQINGALKFKYKNARITIDEELAERYEYVASEEVIRMFKGCNINIDRDIAEALPSMIREMSRDKTIRKWVKHF